VAAELYQKVGDPLPGWARRLLRCLGWPTPRQLACYDVGDILAYYARRRQVLDKIRREVERIVEEHGEKGTRELYLALVGHSMGSVVAFDFLHESQREPGPHVAWRGADTRPSVIVAQGVAGIKVFASGLFTLGSPLALFYRLSSAGEDHQYRDQEPFRLEDGWRNYWDKEDLVCPIWRESLAKRWCKTSLSTTLACLYGVLFVPMADTGAMPGWPGS